jgi:hypothetical protein
MAWNGIERRKMTKAASSFEPQTAFEGYVKASLDNMKERLDSLPCPESFKRLNKCENEIANIKGKATVFGAICGFVAALVTKYILGK